MIADVVLPGRRFQVFTYRVPPPLLSLIHVGVAVMVPLSRAVVYGVVVKVGTTSGTVSGSKFLQNRSIRDILSLASHSEQPPIDHHLLELVKRIAEYYMAPFAACLRLLVPPHSVKVIKRMFITEKGRQAHSFGEGTSEAQAVLGRLSRRSQGLLRSSLIRGVSHPNSLFDRLKKRGWIVEQATVPIENTELPPKAMSLKFNTKKGREDLDLFEDCVTNKEAETLSMDDKGEVTQSLKDWIDSIDLTRHQELFVVDSDLMRREKLVLLVKRVRSNSQASLILTPEVHQAESLAAELRGIWKDSVEVVHGRIPANDRARRWERIRQGHAMVVVGTRSALFLPVANLGLIWVEQEDDDSYKEEHFPYYHAREVARMRGELEGAVTVYGASCPSLQHYAENQNNSMPQILHFRQPLPPIQVVDLGSLPYGTWLSPVLKETVTCGLQSGDQAILFLNQKGFSSVLACEDCGQASSCPLCGVPCKLYQRPARLVCSYCANVQDAPESCPSCQGRVFRLSGIGTQRLEEEISRMFPSAAVARVDGDTIHDPQQVREIFRKFEQGAIHILMGTELLLHQSSLPSAKIVGFLQADIGLHVPDFRSAERTFKVLYEALNLVIPDQSRASIILQTRMPDHHVIKAISQQDSRIFYEQELELRKALEYPPFNQIILLIIIGPPTKKFQQVVNYVHQKIRDLEVKATPGQGIVQPGKILGPIMSNKHGNRKKRRVLFLIKTGFLENTRQHLRSIIHELEAKGELDSMIVEVNVDPIEIQ